MNKNYNVFFLDLYNGKTLHQTERLIPSFSRLNSSSIEKFGNTSGNAAMQAMQAKMQAMQATLNQMPEVVCNGYLGEELMNNATQVAKENGFDGGEDKLTCKQGVGTLVKNCATKCLVSPMNPNGFNSESCKGHPTGSGIGRLSCNAAMTEAGLTQQTVNGLLAQMSTQQPIQNSPVERFSDDNSPQPTEEDVNQISGLLTVLQNQNQSR